MSFVRKDCSQDCYAIISLFNCYNELNAKKYESFEFKNETQIKKDLNFKKSIKILIYIRGSQMMGRDPKVGRGIRILTLSSMRAPKFRD
jgi:hypothetical protein